MQHGSIGIFDSGIGGLTVARAIMEALPNEPITYFGDTARAPYGDRPREQIIRFAREIVSFLSRRGAAVAVAACNTSSALAVPLITGEFDIPIIGMIDCGALAAAEVSGSHRIGVIATANTVKSGAYRAAIERLLVDAVVIEQACPALVPMVEQGEVSGPRVVEAISGYLAPLLDAGVDTIVYGCTHYPFLDSQIRAVAGPSIQLVDPAVRVAKAAKAALLDGGGLSHGSPSPAHYVTSGDPERFADLVHALMGWEIDLPEHVDLASCGSSYREGLRRQATI
ncbi:MAG: glutamate racemase [Clostridia bacterium]|nr:glutamate racemase [Clostridia bacterium]